MKITLHTLVYHMSIISSSCCAIINENELLFLNEIGLETQ